MIPEIMIQIFVFIFGLIVGSFLNVCIVRMPLEQSIVTPRSRCVKCKKMIPWYDNVPLVSFILLKGKCRFCDARISIRYFIVEFLTGLLFVTFYWKVGLAWVLVPYLVMLSGLIVATFVDFEHRIIPDEISVGGMVVGIIFSLLMPSLHGAIQPGIMGHLHSLLSSVIGLLVGGGSIYGLGLLGDFMFKKESMGGGDVKLMAMVGAFMGWQAVLLAFFIAPFFGAVYGIIEKIRTKDSAIAYGPFLALGTLIAFFWGEWLIAWIISGYGLQ